MNASSLPAGVPLPENVDLEQAVLGALLCGRDQIDEIIGACRPSDFFHDPHPAIAEAVWSLYDEKSPITPLSVNVRLENRHILDELGGHAYLGSLALAAPAGGSVALARSLADLRMRRDAILAAQQTQEGLAQGNTAILDAMKPVLASADYVASQLGKRKFVPIRQAADEMLQRAQERAEGKSVVAATTGLEALDKAIGGLQGGDLVVYAGRPGMGKTALMGTTALRAAMVDRPVLFFSLEMTQEALLHRIGTDLDYDGHSDRPLSYSWFRNGSIRSHEIERMALAMRDLPESLTIIENGQMTIQEIAAFSRSFAARQSMMGVVVIDYLQKVSAGDRYRGNRVQEVTEISGAAKALAMTLKWPVVVGAQLNRGIENREEKRPNLTDLRESGSIEQDADVVVGLYRPAYYVEKRKPAAGPQDPAWEAWRADWEQEKNRLDLHILKNRNGAEDSFSVFCDMRASAIRDAAPRGAP